MLVGIILVGMILVGRLGIDNWRNGAAHRKEPVRLHSFRFRNFRKSSFRFGSVRTNISFPLRRGSACVFRTRRGSVRFGSVRFHVRFRPIPELNGSVRFGSAGSVRFLIPSCAQAKRRSELEPDTTFCVPIHVVTGCTLLSIPTCQSCRAFSYMLTRWRRCRHNQLVL